MSFIKEKFIGVQCDNCKEFAENSDGGAFFSDEETARDNAVNGEEWHEEVGKHFCKNCYSFNDNGELIIDETKFVAIISKKKYGWIKINSEADLPKESGQYFVNIKGKIEVGFYHYHYKKWFCSGQYYSDTHQNIGVTHYQSVIKPDLPLI